MTDFKVMLAKNYDPKRVDNWKEMYVEPKLNGVRVIVQATRMSAPRYYSRNGRELGMFTHLNPSVRKLVERLARKSADMVKGVALDCEAVGVTFGDVSGAIHTKGTVALTCRLHVFHAMPLVAFKKGIDSMSQLARNQVLQDALDGGIRGLSSAEPTRVLEHKQVMQAHRRFLNEEYEGTMVKNMCVAWHSNRSWDWMKLKPVETEEVEVVEVKVGTGQNSERTGALMCKRASGKIVRCSGMTNEQREEFWKNRKAMVGKIVEVEYQEETEHGALRHIRFVRVRDDK